MSCRDGQQAQVTEAPALALTLALGASRKTKHPHTQEYEARIASMSLVHTQVSLAGVQG